MFYGFWPTKKSTVIIRRILAYSDIMSIVKILAVKIEVKIKKLKPKTQSGCFTNTPPVEPVPTKCVLSIW